MTGAQPLGCLPLPSQVHLQTPGLGVEQPALGTITVIQDAGCCKQWLNIDHLLEAVT